MAARRPLIRPAATFSPLGRREGFFGFGATKMSRLRRLGGVLAHGHQGVIQAGIRVGGTGNEEG